VVNLAASFAPTTLRVERHTDRYWNELNGLRIEARLVRMKDAQRVEIDERLAELDREWDIERALGANAGTIALASAALGYAVDRRFLLLTTLVFAFLANHALYGWCPPVPVMRRLGVRTMREIERERYALKALRGDFSAVPPAGWAAGHDRVRAVLAAVDA